MFDLSEKRLVWIPLRWNGLKANGDGLAENTEFEIEALVELVDHERLRELFPADTGSELSDAEKFTALVSDWRGVRDGNNPVPFTEANVARLLLVPMFGSGFESSYIKAWTGQVEIREKNSPASSDGGRADEAPAKPKAATRKR